MQKRVWHIAILAVALGVGSEVWLMATPAVDPPRVAGEWTMSGAAGCGKKVPSDLRQWRAISGARRVCRADYAGSTPMRLTLFEMPQSPGDTAFDAWQKWRPAQSGKLGFYKGRFFGVVESPAAGRQALSEFTSEVEKNLPGGSEGRW